MKSIFYLFFFLFLISCSGLKKSFKNSDTFSKGYTGFALYDPEKEEMIYAQNEDQYFVPASNTKLFTFYAAQKILGDSVPGLYYIENDDSLIFWGTGDPSFLHPDFQNKVAFDFLKNHPNDLFYANNFKEVDRLGPGWSWDWYNYYYGTEKSAFPIYGNFVRFQKLLDDSVFSIHPFFFHGNVRADSSLVTYDYRFTRAQFTNDYSFIIKKYDSLEFEIDKPFAGSDTLVIKLLEDTLKRNVQLIPFSDYNNRPFKVLKTTPSDSLFKKMLKESDNFVAEQLLLLCSQVLFDSFDIDAVIDYSKANFLNKLPDELHWIDGSGLSGYNMFTPRSVIALLKMIHQEYPEEKILEYLPVGGESGTIKNNYKADKPYVFAKTGTLSNSICLSGYLLTKRGKKFIFSFMHNNYVIPSSKLKEEMERILWQIHKKY